MGDIELVIKIDEKWFDDMVREEFEDVDELCAVIQHGTPLPKGHGRLIDESKIAVIIETEDGDDFITDAPTIIEANIESEE